MRQLEGDAGQIEPGDSTDHPAFQWVIPEHMPFRWGPRPPVGLLPARPGSGGSRRTRQKAPAPACILVYHSNVIAGGTGWHPIQHRHGADDTEAQTSRAASSSPSEGKGNMRPGPLLRPGAERTAERGARVGVWRGARTMAGTAGAGRGSDTSSHSKGM